MDLANLLFQEISTRGKSSQNDSACSSLKETQTFNNKKNQNLISGSGSSVSPCNILAGMSSSSFVEKEGRNRSSEDLLRCFAMVYERKGTTVRTRVYSLK